jgi:4-hydroxythreonine-4-phosphate dehydrogenase
VSGPYPPDSIFARAAGGAFDIVVAMYHDQGHIPIKTSGFVLNQQTGRMESVSGVNITLGLPIVRVSVDHGTAFDIAWKNVADERSMVDSIEYAAAFAVKRLGK